jgi:hypothetical protein
MSYTALNSFKCPPPPRVLAAKENLNRYYVTVRPDGSQMALVVWGTNLSSSIGSGRITKQVSEMFKLPPYQLSVVIGVLLSDGWARFAAPRSKTALLGFCTINGSF